MKAFIAYVTLMEHDRNLKTYKSGATIIRNGLPNIPKGEFGWRDVLEVKNFCEFVLTEDTNIVEQVAQSDAAATIEALSPDAHKIIMTNPEEINKGIFRNK